jgi:hypothetical protein
MSGVRLSYRQSSIDCLWQTHDRALAIIDNEAVLRANFLIGSRFVPVGRTIRRRRLQQAKQTRFVQG